MRPLFGLLIVAFTLFLVLARYVRARKPRRLPPWGWAGLVVVIAAEILLLQHVYWVSVYFTPIAWTGYLLFIDAATRSLRPQSIPCRSLADTLKLAFWSVPLWLIFEAYNLRLQNWTYVGLPDNSVLQLIGYTWSFATTWPAILMTAEFFEALGCFSKPWRPLRFGAFAGWTFLSLGILFLLVPVMVPARLGQYLFGAVWAGFVLALDPLNHWAKGRSLLADLKTGQTERLKSLLASGIVCGLLWEFWNYWATAKWLYIFPIMQGWKIFEMPILGYLGFPAFALECFVMYEFLGTLRRAVAQRRRVDGWPS